MTHTGIVYSALQVATADNLVFSFCFGATITDLHRRAPSFVDTPHLTTSGLASQLHSHMQSQVLGFIILHSHA